MQADETYALDGTQLYRVVTILRMFARTRARRDEIARSGVLAGVAVVVRQYKRQYFGFEPETTFLNRILQEVCEIVEKLSKDPVHSEALVNHQLHIEIVQLLSSGDAALIEVVALGLTQMASQPAIAGYLFALNLEEPLLKVIEDQELSIKVIGLKLLICLCMQEINRSQVLNLRGMQLILKLLYSDHLELLLHTARMLELLAQDSDGRDEILQLGGVGLLLTRLRNLEPFPSKAGPPLGDPSAELSPETRAVAVMTLQASICAVLASLSRSDLGANLIRENNGGHIIAMLTLPGEAMAEVADVRTARRNIQAQAFRALRFLFSFERSRRLFKMLFEPPLFELFLQVGHYCSNIAKYTQLVDYLETSAADRRVLEAYRNRILEIDITRGPSLEVIDDKSGEIFCLWEKLGEGAFGAVHCARKKIEAGSRAEGDSVG